MALDITRDDYVDPAIDDSSELAKTASRALARAANQQISVALDDGKTLPLPKEVTKFLVSILTELSAGNMVNIVPIHTELSTQEAANHLNVSRPYLVKLLEKGRLPFHMVGSHRRIKFSDLKTFMDIQSSEREAAMQLLADQAQDEDMGY